MGTRADFYMGKDKDAEWLGSVGWDGCPDAIAKAVKEAEGADEYRAAVAEFFAGRDDVTLPGDGWPWPWNDSNTTDYAYAFFDGGVKASCFGNNWFDPARAEAIEDEEERDQYEETGIGFKPEFPDMSGRKAVAMGKQSGLIVVGG